MGIQRGDIAAVRWLDVVSNDPGGADAQKVFADLLKYCELDTFAMVEIFKRVRSEVTYPASAG